MEAEKFIKIADRDAYINTRYIVLFEFNNSASIGEAAVLCGAQLSREKVYRKDVEDLITNTK